MAHILEDLRVSMNYQVSVQTKNSKKNTYRAFLKFPLNAPQDAIRSIFSDTILWCSEFIKGKHKVERQGQTTITIDLPNKETAMYFKLVWA